MSIPFNIHKLRTNLTLKGTLLKPNKLQDSGEKIFDT